jgi:hypothetical protein
MNHVLSECSDSAKSEIQHQLEEMQKHSGKDSTDILPKPEKIVTGIKNRRGKKKGFTKNEDGPRERLYATIFNTINYGK